jgi:hypothetical protein
MDDAKVMCFQRLATATLLSFRMAQVACPERNTVQGPEMSERIQIHKARSLKIGFDIKLPML